MSFMVLLAQWLDNFTRFYSSSINLPLINNLLPMYLFINNVMNYIISNISFLIFTVTRQGIKNVISSFFINMLSNILNNILYMFWRSK